MKKESGEQREDQVSFIICHYEKLLGALVEKYGIPKSVVREERDKTPQTDSLSRSEISKIKTEINKKNGTGSGSG